jgi:hypothetical protein
MHLQKRLRKLAGPFAAASQQRPFIMLTTSDGGADIQRTDPYTLVIGVFRVGGFVTPYTVVATNTTGVNWSFF